MNCARTLWSDSWKASGFYRIIFPCPGEFLYQCNGDAVRIGVKRAGDPGTCFTPVALVPTAFVDRYTILMAVTAIVQTVVAVLSRKKEEIKSEVQITDRGLSGKIDF